LGVCWASDASTQQNGGESRNGEESAHHEANFNMNV
jgi:hypothetical protein